MTHREHAQRQVDAPARVGRSSQRRDPTAVLEAAGTAWHGAGLAQQGLGTDVLDVQGEPRQRDRQDLAWLELLRQAPPVGEERAQRERLLAVPGLSLERRIGPPDDERVERGVGQGSAGDRRPSACGWVSRTAGRGSSAASLPRGPCAGRVRPPAAGAGARPGGRARPRALHGERARLRELAEVVVRREADALQKEVQFARPSRPVVTRSNAPPRRVDSILIPRRRAPHLAGAPNPSGTPRDRAELPRRTHRREPVPRARMQRSRLDSVLSAGPGPPRSHALAMLFAARRCFVALAPITACGVTSTRDRRAARRSSTLHASRALRRRALLPRDSSCAPRTRACNGTCTVRLHPLEAQALTVVEFDLWHLTVGTPCATSRGALLEFARTIRASSACDWPSRSSPATTPSSPSTTAARPVKGLMFSGHRERAARPRSSPRASARTRAGGSRAGTSPRIALRPRSA